MTKEELIQKYTEKSCDLIPLWDDADEADDAVSYFYYHHTLLQWEEFLNDLRGLNEH